MYASNRQTEGDYEKDYKEFFKAGAEVKDGEWVFDEIRVVHQLIMHSFQNTSSNLLQNSVPLAVFISEGLESNAAYIVSGQEQQHQALLRPPVQLHHAPYAR